MRATFTPLLHTDEREDGTHLVIIRIYYNKVRRYVSSTQGYAVRGKDWNPENADAPVRKSNPAWRQVNKWIEQTIIRGKTLIDEWERAKQPVSADRLRLELAREPIGQEGSSPLFFAWADRHISDLHQLVQNQKVALSTYKNFKSTLKYLKAYRQARDFSFQELTPEFAEGFKTFMLTQKKAAGTPGGTDKPLKYNSVYSIIKKADKLVSDGLKAQKLPAQLNPFSSLELKGPDKVYKQRLTEEELTTFAQLDPLDRFIQPNGNGKMDARLHAQQLFLLCYNCQGVRISDMVMMRWENLEWEAGLPVRMNYIMIKGGHGKAKSIKLKSGAQQILQHYWGTGQKSRHFIFPFLDNAKDYSHREIRDKAISAATADVNKLLKKIARAAGIEKNISTHIARHTFARKAIGAVKNTKVLMDLMGHSKLSTTQGYVEEFNQTDQDEAMDTIFE